MPTMSMKKRETARPQKVELSLAHSPDSDDAFMFYALATAKIRSGHYRFVHTLADIETLNRKAQEGIYDITAISFHAYAFLSKLYWILPCGGSFGDRYGPIVVGKDPRACETLKGKRIAVPGRLTTAYLALRLYEPDFEPLFTPYDLIFDRVNNGEAEAGVVIHEGQLTYASEGFTKVVDLGEWWYGETHLPLPLGGNAIRRSLDSRTARQVARLIQQSIQYAFDHREEALAYGLQFSRGLDASAGDRFVSMYVNELTLDCGERGRLAIQTLFDRAFEKGVLQHPVKAEYVS